MAVTDISIIESASDISSALKQLADLKFALDEAAIVATTDQRGRITYVNDQFCEISKYTREELLGQDHRIINSGYHSKEFIRAIWDTITKGKVWRGEIRNRAKDGKIYWVDTTIVPFVRADGTPFQYTAIRYEITERKLAEERIRQQASLLDKAQDGILVCDLNRRIIYWNKGAERIYGWSLDEVLGRDINAVLQKEGDNSISPRFDELDEWKAELRHTTKTRAAISVISRWTLVRGERGQPDYYLITNTDITEQKKSEEHLLRAQRMESIGTLAGGIAHDLNNILSPILMSVEMIQLNDSSPETHRWASMIRESAERGADLLKQVLTFARGVEGDRVLVQTRHVLKDLLAVLKETLPKTIEVTSDIASDLWPISADPTRVHQVFMNLCINARDAMPGGGSLSLRAFNFEVAVEFARRNPNARIGHYVAVVVEDTGVGMTPDILTRMFDPFFTTKGVGEGTGLGLSTTQTIVDSHDGFILVESEPNKGSRFTVYLPAIRSDLTDLKVPTAPTYPVGKGETILLVDDESDLRDVLTTALEKFGYNVLSAVDGTDAIEKFAQNRDTVNLVLTDLAMPFLDGVGTIHSISRIEPRMRFLAMSGMVSAEAATELEGLGIPVISKPIAAKDLLSAIASQLNAE